jgi:hypothetical protein
VATTTSPPPQKQTTPQEAKQSNLPSVSPSKDGGDIPYTLYSVEKPSDKSQKKKKKKNTKTTTTTNKEPFPDPDTEEAGHDTAKATEKPQPREQHPDAGKIITVVAATQQSQTLEPELVQLKAITQFEPLVKPSSWRFVAQTNPTELDSQGLTALAAEYQSFLKRGAAVITQQQGVLCNKIKQREKRVLEMSLQLEQEIASAKHYEQMFQDVEKVKQQVRTTWQMLNQIISITEEVCGMLPQQYQLASIRSFIEEPSAKLQYPILHSPKDHNKEETAQSQTHADSNETTVTQQPQEQEQEQQQQQQTEMVNPVSTSSTTEEGQQEEENTKEIEEHQT